MATIDGVSWRGVRKLDGHYSEPGAARHPWNYAIFAGLLTQPWFGVSVLSRSSSAAHLAVS